jgi:ATP-dependent protease HslVU (ClpYQ) peptidase subunit
MTCIVACVHKGKVHMAGDRMGSDGFVHNVFNKTKKVFKVEDFIIGYTSSFRMGQILQYSWQPPARLVTDKNDEHYIYKTVVDSIKKCFEANDFGKKDSVEFSGGNFLLGWKGRLFEVQNNLSLLEVESYASVGCGCYHALAGMKTMNSFKILDKEPEKFLAKAIDIAAECVTGVSKEYDYVVEE